MIMMRDEVSLGDKILHRLVFENIEKNSWGEPAIYYEYDTLFGNKRQEMKDYEVSALIELVEKFIQARVKHKDKETKKLKKQLDDIRKELEKN